MPRIQLKTLEQPTWVYRKTNQRFLWFQVVEVSWCFKQLQAARRSACSCYEPLQPWLLGRRSHSAVTMSSQNITSSIGNWDQAFIMTFEEFYRFFRNQLQNDPLVLFSHSPQRGSSCVLLQKVLQPAMIQRRTRSASTKVLRFTSPLCDFERKCYAVSFRCLNQGSANLSVTQACVLILSLSSHQTTRYLTTSGWHPSSSGSVHKSYSAHSHTAGWNENYLQILRPNSPS